MTVSLARFARFDLANIATTQPLRVLLPILLAAVFAVTLPVQGAGIVIGAVIAAVTVSVPFQGDEHGRLDVLYGLAPVGRAAVVLGRYLSLLVIALATVGVGALTSFVVGGVRQQPAAWPVVATMLLVAVGVVSVAIAVQVPWFFALGFHRGRPMIYVPVAVIAVVGFIAGRTGLFDGPVDVAVGLPPLAATVGVLVLAALLLAVSAVIAIRVYARREL